MNDGTYATDYSAEHLFVPTYLPTYLLRTYLPTTDISMLYLLLTSLCESAVIPKAEMALDNTIRSLSGPLEPDHLLMMLLVFLSLYERSRLVEKPAAI